MIWEKIYFLAIIRIKAIQMNKLCRKDKAKILIKTMKEVRNGGKILQTKTQ